MFIIFIRPRGVKYTTCSMKERRDDQQHQRLFRHTQYYKVERKGSDMSKIVINKTLLSAFYGGGKKNK